MNFRSILLLSSLIIFSGCNDKWWGDKKIAEISSESGVTEYFTYNDEGRLTHYKSTYKSKYDVSPRVDILFNVDFTYSEGTVIMKGIVPYKAGKYDQEIYVDTETTYTLNEDNLAYYAETTVADSIGNNLYANFKYNKKNQLTQLNENVFPYLNDNLDFSSIPSGGALISFHYTFAKYIEITNKSYLPGILDEYLGIHRPAFFAHILGRPSKMLVYEYAVERDGSQFSANYRYSLDKEGYVTKLNKSSKFIPHSWNEAFIIKYVP